MTALAESLKERLPPSDITPQQLKERSWWSGPDVYVLIDDYDLIGGGSLNHPLSPLIEYLPLARDIGLRDRDHPPHRRSGPRADGSHHRPAEGSVMQRFGDERFEGGGRSLRRVQADRDAAGKRNAGVSHRTKRRDSAVLGAGPVTGIREFRPRVDLVPSARACLGVRARWAHATRCGVAARCVGGDSGPRTGQVGALA